MKRKLILIAAIGGAFLTSACSQRGGLNVGNLDQGLHLLNAGGRFLNAESLSEKDEDAIGQSVAASVTTSYGLDRNIELTKYVTLVGLTVANSSPNAGGNWVFGVLDTPEVNAFSGPNGYVFVTRGALMRMHDEAELAGVLGHEIAHVNHHDGLHLLQSAEKAGALHDAMAASNSDVSRFSALTDSGVDFITKTGYDQPQEFAADHDGVTYMAAAGYDPQSYLHFLQREAKSGGGMSTHPGGAQRVQKVSEQLASMPQGGQTLAERFQQAMQAR